MPLVSIRVRMLIKNMLEYRAKGWEFTFKQEESGPMKVNELRQTTLKMLREEKAISMQAEKEEQSYLRVGGGKISKKTVAYQEKGSGGQDDRRGGDDIKGSKLAKNSNKPGSLKPAKQKKQKYQVIEDS